MKLSLEPLSATKFSYVGLMGYRMETLEVQMSDRNRDCTRADCIPTSTAAVG